MGGYRDTGLWQGNYPAAGIALYLTSAHKNMVLVILVLMIHHAGSGTLSGINEGSETTKLVDNNGDT
ncbi:MAG: hypothetical protein Q8N94_09375 [Methanoregula sp.]|nr:hypothetical protein [Methanoregula sp.]